METSRVHIICANIISKRIAACGNSLRMGKRENALSSPRMTAFVDGGNIGHVPGIAAITVANENVFNPWPDRFEV